MDTVDCTQQVARRPAAPSPVVAQDGALDPGAGCGAGRDGARPPRIVGARLAGASRGPRRARRTAGGAASRGDALVFRRIVAPRDCPADQPAARHREDPLTDGASETDGQARASQGLVGMTDWLGMGASPRTPRPELKGRVLERARMRQRRWPLAVAALLLVGAGGAGWWAKRTIDALTVERARLAKIGRASCRERGESSGVGVAVEKKDRATAS